MIVVIKIIIVVPATLCDDLRRFFAQPVYDSVAGRTVSKRGWAC